MSQSKIFLALKSLAFDWEFLFCRYPKGFLPKLELLAKKYYLLTKHLLFNEPTIPGRSRIKLWGKWVYYESTFGLLGLQTTTVNIQKNFLNHIGHLTSPVIIDVGAYLGFFSLNLASLFDKATIYACEPVGLTFNLLKKNCQATRSIIPLNIGFSATPGKKKIYYKNDLLMYSSIFSDRFLWTKPKSENIRLTTLDRFIEKMNITKIDFLKIDAEGAEEAILKGAENCLAKTKFLALEISLDGVGNTTFSSINHYLYGNKYNFQLIGVGNILSGPAGQILTVDLLLRNLYAEEQR